MTYILAMEKSSDIIHKYSFLLRILRICADDVNTLTIVTTRQITTKRSLLES